MIIDTNDAGAFRSSILNAIVAPRPIGWISSVDAEGRVNLAPFSYFNAVSATPPMVVFSVNAAADRAEKDTLANVRAVPEFVANFACFDLREAISLTSATAPYGLDEFDLARLRAAASVKVTPPRVADAPANLECTVVRIVDLPPQGPGERHAALVIGRVVTIHVQDAYLDPNGRFDTVRARPIARMGGSSYATLGEVFDMPRPPWPLPGDSDTPPR